MAVALLGAFALLAALLVTVAVRAALRSLASQVILARGRRGATARERGACITLRSEAR